MKPQLACFCCFWLASLFFSLRFSSAVSCSQDKLCFHHSRLSVVFHSWRSISASEPCLPSSASCPQRPSRCVLMLSRRAVFFTSWRTGNQEICFGFVYVFRRNSERKKSLSLEVAIEEFYPEDSEDCLQWLSCSWGGSFSRGDSSVCCSGTGHDLTAFSNHWPNPHGFFLDLPSTLIPLPVFTD